MHSCAAGRVQNVKSRKSVSPTAGPDRRFYLRHSAIGLLQPWSCLGTFKSILFSLPSSPAASPAALAATGGLAGMASKLATAGDAKSGHAGPAKTPEVASLALPRPGCIGWVVV